MTGFSADERPRRQPENAPLATGDNWPPAARLAKITRPTLVATGGASPESFVAGGGDFFARAADAIVTAIPNAERLTLAGQAHMVDPKALAPVLGRFFGA
jgi:pimeloyl-ACP methyl ester carboxylesterase